MVVPLPKREGIEVIWYNIHWADGLLLRPTIGWVPMKKPLFTYSILSGLIKNDVKLWFRVRVGRIGWMVGKWREREHFVEWSGMEKRNRLISPILAKHQGIPWLHCAILYLLRKWGIEWNNAPWRIDYVEVKGICQIESFDRVKL